MDPSLTNSFEQLADAARDTTDWRGMTRGAQIRSLELDGFVVLADLLDDARLRAIRLEMARLETTPVDYSEHQRGCPDVQWTASPTALQTVALPRMIEFLGHVLGDDLVCTSVSYAVSEPGHPGIALHTDAQPYGSRIFGMQASAPVLVRVLYYLDDLTPARSPFKVIPRSHLSLHRDANPYHRYLSHPDEVMVTCRAGSAVVINQRVFHGNFPNFSDEPRRLLAIAYRPAWAGPIGTVPERDAERVARLPADVQPFFRSPNTRFADYDVPNRPDGMPRRADGLSPQRWSGTPPDG